MPIIPWKAAQAPAAGARYLALISYLPLVHYRALPKFFRFTRETLVQLRNTPGLMGFSLDARPLTKEFWTLSAWRDQQSLADFVGKVPHSEIMKALAPHMGKSQFAQWSVEAHELPLDWNSAKARITRS
jgi:hypothetical protein